MTDRLVLLVLLSATIVSACATGPTRPVDASGSAMLGLTEKPKHPVWEEWSAEPIPSVSPEVLGPLEAFDYWQLDESEYVESAWAATSTLIDSVRRQSDDKRVRDTATLMLEALEPGKASNLVVDATFYVTERREGVALRFLRALEPAGTAAFVLMLDRRAGGAPKPDRIRMVATPGFEEPRAFRVDLRRDGGSWVATVRGAAERDDGDDGSNIEEADLYASVLVSQIWQPLTGADYASARMRSAEATELPAPFLKALGLEVADRDIDRVFTNSVFTPRMDDFSPGAEL